MSKRNILFTWNLRVICFDVFRLLEFHGAIADNLIFIFNFQNGAVQNQLPDVCLIW
jgi:hypothetical protein